jgi:hypothetical protein
MNGVSEKRHAHELLERLPDSQVGTAIGFLEFMLLDPVARAVATARPDDEPVTDEDRTRLYAGQAWFAQRGGKQGDTDGRCSGRVRSQPGGFSDFARGCPLTPQPCRLTASIGSTKPRPKSRALDRPSAMRMFEGILRFAQTGSGDVNALHGNMGGSFRLRLGDYRVLFALEDDVMRIFGVRHRCQAYR